MARTVKVGLALQVADYVKPAEQAAKSTKSVGEELAEAAKAGDRTASALDDVGGEMTDAARAAAALDKQIEELTGSLRELAVQQALAGDGGADLAEKMRQQEAKLRQTVRNRKLIDPGEGVKEAVDAGAQLASTVSVSFAARLGPLLARVPIGGMNPVGLAIGAPIAIAAASVIGTAVGGAVVGAAGVGGVVGGLVLASKDARVKASGEALGKLVNEVLTDSASAFVPAALDGIELIGARMRGLGPGLERIFDQASTYVTPLIDDAFRTVEHMMPGIIRAVEQAGPVLDAIGDGFVRLGDASSDVLTMLADNADEGARALDVMFQVADIGIRTIGNSLEALTGIFEFLDENGGWTWKMLTGTQEAGRGAEDLAGKYEDVKIETRSLEEQVNDLNTAFDELFNTQLGVDQAAINYRQGIRDLSEELKDGKRTLSENSEEGLTNRQAMLDQIGVIEQNRQARLKNKEGIEETNEKYVAEIDALRRQAIAAGFSETEVNALTAAYRAVPKKVETTITANTGPAMAAAVKLAQYLKNIPDEDVYIGIRITGASYSEAEAAIRKQYANRHGGVYEHAQDGLLREAAYYTPRNPGRYMIAEPGTQGEAFVPRNGDYDRSMGILNKAAGWYRASVVPQGALQAAYAAGRRAQPDQAQTPAPGVDWGQVARVFRSSLAGMSVQMDGRTVGYVTGREADLYARS